VPQGGKVLALGTVDDVKQLFATEMKGEVERVPIVPKDLARDQGAVISLLLSALTRTFAQTHGLETDGEKVLWSKKVMQRSRVNGTAYLVHDGVLLFLRRYAGKQFLVLKPTIKTFTEAGEPAELDVDRELKRQILGKQWNSKFNAALMRWRELLLRKDALRVEFPAGSGSTFKFNLAAAVDEFVLPRPMPQTDDPELAWGYLFLHEFAPRLAGALPDGAVKASPAIYTDYVTAYIHFTHDGVSQRLWLAVTPERARYNVKGCGSMLWLAEPTDTTYPAELAARFTSAGFERRPQTPYRSLRVGVEVSEVQAAGADGEVSHALAWALNALEPTGILATTQGEKT